MLIHKLLTRNIRHGENHTGKKPLKRKHCNESLFRIFPSISTYTEHKGEKPCIYGTCGFMFTVKNNPTEHMNTHPG